MNRAVDSFWLINTLETYINKEFMQKGTTLALKTWDWLPSKVGAFKLNFSKKDFILPKLSRKPDLPQNEVKITRTNIYELPDTICTSLLYEILVEWSK